MAHLRNLLIGFLIIAACTEAGETPAPACETVRFADAPYTVCTFDPATDDIRLFLNSAAGTPYAQFDTLKDALETDGKTLVFAMNAGMYNEARAPIGLYVEDGNQHKNANTNDGPGNFHLKPNGVFYLSGAQAGVMETAAYLAAGLTPDYATQSGPMLVIDGAIHPAFNPEGTSRKRRNGVGVQADGHIVFVISEVPVTFHAFASLFQGELMTPNALFLDGSVSKIYTSHSGRNDKGLDMGPIVGVVE